MSIDFFDHLDDLQADPELVESKEDRKAFDDSFEEELLKQWKTAKDGKLMQQQQTTDISTTSHERTKGDQLDLGNATDISSSQIEISDPLMPSETLMPATPHLSRPPILSPNLPTTMTGKITTTINSSPTSSSSTSQPQAGPSRPIPTRKPTLDLRFTTQTSKVETKDQRTFREGFEKLKRQIDKAMTKEKTQGRGGMVPPNQFARQSSLLEGLTFVVVWSPRGWNVVKNILEKIHQHGGDFMLQYEPGVTHLLCADDMSDVDFLKHSNFSSISDVPKDVVCLKVNWLHECIQWKALRPVEEFIHPTPARNPSFKRKEVKKSRPPPTKKRRYEPTDSDTTESHHTLPPLTKSVISTQTNADTSETVDPDSANPIGLGDIVEADEEEATRQGHANERWLLPPGVKADALDEIISGIDRGTITGADEIAAGLHDGLPSDDEGQKSEHNEVMGRQTRELDVRALTVERKEARAVGGLFKCQQAHDGLNEGSINEDIALELEKLGEKYKGDLHKNSFSTNSYFKAASKLRAIPYRIETRKQAVELKFIGQGLADRIEEYLRYGKTLRGEYEDTPQSRAVSAFAKIYGVGTSTANVLWNAGARSLEDLRGPGNPWGLTANMLYGLKHYNDLNERMPRAEAEALFNIIAAEARSIDPLIQIDAMGSYRRGEETCGDLDCLITRDPSDGKTHAGIVAKLLPRLHDLGIIDYTVSDARDYKNLECKWHGCGRVNSTSKLRRIDLLTIPFDHYGAALIYFTGNDIFNRSIRLYANKRGFSLNQRGLYAGVMRDPKTRKKIEGGEGHIVASRTEQEIFDVLGIRWREPRSRRP